MAETAKHMGYLVLEYFPHAMDCSELQPCRVDGHYSDAAEAEEVADMWAKEPMHPESRIIVAKVGHESRTPDHWKAS